MRIVRAATVAVVAMLAVAEATAQPRTPDAPPSSTIRVAVVLDARAVEVNGEQIDVVEQGVCERCARARWRAGTVRATAGASGIEADGRRAASFRLQSDRPMRLNGREYAGTLDLVRNGEGLVVVDELPLEDYLAGVLRAEIGDRWPPEALRAQAIVSRTYAAYQRRLNAAKPYHIMASTAHQQFVGRVAPSSPVWDAVRETTGQVLRWEGQLFPAFYHTDSGGYTEDPRLVFAAGNMPALRPVHCEFSTGSPHYAWTLDVKLADVGEILRRNDVGVGPVRRIEIAERTPSLRASIVAVYGARGSVRLRGNDFRRLIGYDTLKSTLFAVAVDGDTAHFAGRGYGHGVGLSQWGAKGMAEQGYSARQILEFYYRGATLGWIDER
jgi:stage II sporulation protein D (peptidoglycan lytic transglycosylase)